MDTHETWKKCRTKISQMSEFHWSIGLVLKTSCMLHNVCWNPERLQNAQTSKWKQNLDCALYRCKTVIHLLPNLDLYTIKGQNNINLLWSNVTFALNLSFRAFIFCSNLPWLGCVITVGHGAYFHEEIESSITSVIYFLNDNLLAKSLSVIVKSPAWLVGRTAYLVEALMRWTEMQFGKMGCGGSVSQITHCARHAINFSSEVPGVFLASVLAGEKKYLSGCGVSWVLFCVCLCVFDSMAPTWCFLPVVCMCGNSSVCGLNSACVCVCLRDGMGCMFTGLQSGAGWQPAETKGLENGVCLCVPLLSQRDTRQLSPSLSFSLRLSIVHTHFSTSLIISSLLSPLLAPALLMFSRYISDRSCFLCIHFSPLIVFSPLRWDPSLGPHRPASCPSQSAAQIGLGTWKWKTRTENDKC